MYLPQTPVVRGCVVIIRNDFAAPVAFSGILLAEFSQIARFLI